MTVLIGIDVDGVLRDFRSALDEVWLRAGRQIYTVPDMPDRDEWSESHWGADISEICAFYYEHCRDVTFLAEPYEGAERFVKSLMDMGHDVVLISDQPTYQTRLLTLIWIGDHIRVDVGGICFLGPEARTRLDLDVLIDDDPVTVESAQQNGIQAVAIERPWNAGCKPRVKGYGECLLWIANL